MNEAKTKFEPWQLILVVVLLLSVFGGLYVLNQAVDARLDSVEQGLQAKTETILNRMDSIRSATQTAIAELKAQPAVAAPTPAPAAEPAVAAAPPDPAAAEPKPDQKKK